MSSLSSGEACSRLADNLEHHWSADEDLNRIHRQMIASLRSVGNGESKETSGVRAFMPPLAGHVEQILQKGRPEQFKTAILSALADITREVPFWRPLFGLETKPNYPTNLKQLKRESPPDSILEVARRIISGTIQVLSSEQMRAALRIIANSCADNNVNRSIIVNRDGIEALLELLINERDSDLVIPVLYNVCIDYDEPATDVHGKPWTLPEMQGVADSEISPEPTLSAAEQRLGTCWFPYENMTSFQILMRARKHAGDCAGTIADLIEMASRVAFYGTDNFVQEHIGSEPGDIIEVDTTPAIVRQLLADGADLASEDAECRVSICQAVLNVLSQPDTHAKVVDIGDALNSLIHLPYTPNTDGDFDEEEEETLAPYKKEVLKLVYKISATDAYTQGFKADSLTTRNYIETLDSFLASPSTSTRGAPNGPLASICVLLANSITTTGGAKNLLRFTTIAWTLLSTLIKISDPEVLLPAIDLATRLALCREGQDAFCTEVNMFSATAKVLSNKTSELDATGLEIQRNAIALTRLLVKGRSDHIQHFKINVSNPNNDRKDLLKPTSLAVEICNLYDRTTDSQTKLEIGRLFIEILRTIYSSNEQSMAQGITTATSEVGADSDTTTSQTAESYFLDIFGDFDAPQETSSTQRFRDTVTDSISYILTQSQSQPQAQPQSQSQTPTIPPAQPPNQAAEAEAWFGLALLSTISSARRSIRTVLARNDSQLLNRLREIVEENTSTPDRHDSNNAQLEEQDQSQIWQNVKKDPRYENIKVIVVKMLQLQGQGQSTSKQSQNQDQPHSASKDEEVVQAGLEAAAAEMGLDWVVL